MPRLFPGLNMPAELPDADPVKLESTFGSDPLFKPHERLETYRTPMVQITEANLVEVAKALGMALDFSGDRPTIHPATERAGYGRSFGVGDWVDAEGNRQIGYGWVPAGTYRRTEDGEG